MTTIMLENTTNEQTYTELEKDKVAHYVISPNDNETNHAYVMRARVEGFAVTALCGYTWVPIRMANELPVCGECEDISLGYPQGDRSAPHE